MKLIHASKEVSTLRQSVLLLAKQLAMFPVLAGPLTMKEEYDLKCAEVEHLYKVIDTEKEAVKELHDQVTQLKAKCDALQLQVAGAP